MKKISVVLAVFNEESNLDKVLSSVKDLAWEIVIVDGGSTDGTLEIAKKYNPKVIKTENHLNFHINKQMGIDSAKGDWIFQLDADEVVTNELRNEIESRLSSDSGTNGYWIPRSNFFLTKFLTKGGQYPDYTMRLYKKGHGRLPVKDVHEQAVVEGKTDYLKNPLLHYRDTSFSKYIEGLNRYTTFIGLQMGERSEKINPFTFIKYFLIMPNYWFLKTYLRNRGYVDGFPGFVFCYFSSLRFPISYIKYWASINNNKRK